MSTCQEISSKVCDIVFNPKCQDNAGWLYTLVAKKPKTDPVCRSLNDAMKEMQKHGVQNWMAEDIAVGVETLMMDTIIPLATQHGYSRSMLIWSRDHFLGVGFKDPAMAGLLDKKTMAELRKTLCSRVSEYLRNHYEYLKTENHHPYSDYRQNGRATFGASQYAIQ